MKQKRISLMIIIMLIANLFLTTGSLAETTTVINEGDKQSKDAEKDIFDDIEAPNLLLAQTDTGKILYERQADKKIYPASTTKLMTAILVVENCELDEIVTVSENAVKSVPPDYVTANLQVGEELTVNDLMYVMLIPSANDAANVLAEHVGGSIESFATMMNTRAKELGCTGTNFTNPSGLQDKNHYTTTKDLFLIAQEAISKSFIKKIIGTTTYTLNNTNQYTGTKRTFTTTNYMKQKSLSKYYCDYCIGGKTGYTGDAKNCVVEYAQKDGMELTAIVMGENASVKGKKFLDAKEMFEYAFKNYENKRMISKDEKYETVKINNGTNETKMLDVLYGSDISILKEKQKDVNFIEPTEDVQKTVEYYDLKAPIQKGKNVGKITYEYQGITYSTKLIAGEDVEESIVLANLTKLLLVALFIYIIYILKKSKRNFRKSWKKF